MRLFTQMTQTLLVKKRVSGFFLQGHAEPPLEIEKFAFRTAFRGKSAMKGVGVGMLPWGDWLVESLFPSHIYLEHGCSLRSMIKDERIWEIAGFSGNNNNSFGRMARPRDTVPEGFVGFLLDRWSGKYRGMPHFWFDVEYPEWVCAPLIGRPDIPKTGRTSVSCVMNYGFHWLDGKANITIGLRHLNWSHGWGDVFGAYAALSAICNEFLPGEVPIGQVTIFANSASMDEPKIAKTYLAGLEH